MFCPECGAQAAATHKFCTKCGTAIVFDGQGARPALPPSPPAARSSVPPPLPPMAAKPPAQSVAPAHSVYASFWRRMVALIVDYVVVVLVCVVAGAITNVTILNSSNPAFVQLTLWILLLYKAAMESSRRQATLGKLLGGIKVTSLNGGRISFLRGLGRNGAQALSAMIFYIGFLMAAFTQRRQALHDLIAGTLVTRQRYSQAEIAVTTAATPQSSAVPIVVAAVGAVAVIGILAAIAIPAYQDYTIRTQVTEGLNTAATYKAAVAERASQGQPLGELTSERLEMPETGQWHYVQSIKIVSGIVAITYGASAHSAISGKTVLLIPATTDGGQSLVWACGHHPLPDGSIPVIDKDLGAYATVADKYLPFACKSTS
jgi:uncharacterized RDD family membrane protein YckC/Tfp pilus assembly major pilin PilA